MPSYIWWMRFIIASFSLLLCLFIFDSCNRCKEECINGICIDKSCACDEWYSGNTCNELFLSRYAGYYSGEIVADTMRTRVGFNLVTDPANPAELECDSISMRLVFDDETRFSIVEQSWNGAVVNGDGEMLVESISFQFKSGETPGDLQYTLLAFRRN